MKKILTVGSKVLQEYDWHGAWRACPEPVSYAFQMSRTFASKVCPFEHTKMMFKLYFGHIFNICTRWDAYCILNVDILK